MCLLLNSFLLLYSAGRDVRGLFEINPFVENLVSITQNCTKTHISLTLSSKTWCQSPKPVIKPCFFLCWKQVRRWSIDSYIFAHAAVFGTHGVLVRRMFLFWWMNPLAGFGVSIARNCSETQILSSRTCSAQCTGRFNAHEMVS